MQSESLYWLIYGMGRCVKVHFIQIKIYPIIPPPYHHGGRHRRLREGQGQVPSIPYHCDWLLGQLQPQLHRLRRLGGGHQAPVLRGGSGDLRLRK